MSRRTVLFAGGGSGGHLFPGLAVAEELAARDPGCRVVFAGSGREIERTVLAGTGYRHVALPIAPPATARRHPFRFACGLGESLRAAFRLLDEYRPEAVIGLGGFASVPLAIAARRRGVPLLLLEQNVVPGRATSWLSRWAERVCVSFEETRGFLPKRTPTLVTGNPVRRAIAASGGRRRDVRHTTDPPTLLVLGGSQGAAGVNATAVAALAGSERKDEWRIVHQTGERDASAVRAAYSNAGLSAEVAAYFPDLPSRYVEASLVVSRAGATTLAELACLGVPTILVPYPGAVRDHQRKNAEHFASAGGALIVPEGPTAADRLRRVLDELSDAPDRLADMSRAMRALARPDAASAVADVFMPRAVMTRAA